MKTPRAVLIPWTAPIVIALATLGALTLTLSIPPGDGSPPPAVTASAVPVAMDPGAVGEAATAPPRTAREDTAAHAFDDGPRATSIDMPPEVAPEVAPDIPGGDDAAAKPAPTPAITDRFRALAADIEAAGGTGGTTSGGGATAALPFGLSPASMSSSNPGPDPGPTPGNTDAGAPGTGEPNPPASLRPLLLGAPPVPSVPSANEADPPPPGAPSWLGEDTAFPVPEPGSLALLGLGLAASWPLRRRRGRFTA